MTGQSKKDATITPRKSLQENKLTFPFVNTFATEFTVWVFLISCYYPLQKHVGARNSTTKELFQKLIWNDIISLTQFPPAFYH